MNKEMLQELQKYIRLNLKIHIGEEFIGDRQKLHVDIKEPIQELRQFYYSVPKSYEVAKRQASEKALEEKQKAEKKSEEELQAVLAKFRKTPRESHASSLPSEKDIENYLKNTKRAETFSTMLLKYIDETGLSDSEIYKRAGLDRRHFSKIRCNKNYRPKKETAVMLCIALRLNLEQSEELLKMAGYSFSFSDTGDLIVKFCIERQIYNLMDVNEALEYFGERALGVVG